MSSLTVQLQHSTGVFSSVVNYCREQLSQVQQVALKVFGNEQTGKALCQGYNAYSVACSYPNQPLYVLCTPALTAANVICPKLMKKLAALLPKQVEGSIAFEASLTQLVKEATVAGLFLYYVTAVPLTESQRIAASVIMMGVFNSVINSGSK